MSKEEIQHLQKMLEDLEKNTDSYVLRQKQDTINDLIHEKSVIEKDKQFYKHKSDKLEENLFINEKHLLRLEADSKYGASESNHALRVENESLRDDLYNEKKKYGRFGDKSGKLHDISDHANSENDRVKQILRRRIDQKIDDLSQASNNRDPHAGFVHRDMYETMDRSGKFEKRMLNKPERETSDIKYVENGRINTIPRSSNSPMGTKLLNSGNSGISGHSTMYNKNIL